MRKGPIIFGTKFGKFGKMWIYMIVYLKKSFLMGVQIQSIHEYDLVGSPFNLLFSILYLLKKNCSCDSVSHKKCDRKQQNIPSMKRHFVAILSVLILLLRCVKLILGASSTQFGDDICDTLGDIEGKTGGFSTPPTGHG